MPESKKYYYLKLKEGFFDSDEMIVLESMPDGYLYSNILLKLYLRSLKYQGRLMFNDRIPFNSTMLAQVTRHSVGVVEKAMRILQDLGLVEILDNGAIYMSDIQNFIGRSSTEADRIREYRNQIESEKSCNKLQRTNVQQMNCKSTPEIEIEKDTELKIELEKERESKRKRFTPPSVDEVREYCNEINATISPGAFVDYYAAQGWVYGKSGKQMKDWKAAVRNWQRREKTTTGNVFLEIAREEGLI